MSEYWVSQAKKHCDFCKCWIADNKPSRDFHEKGKRHQDNVKKKIEEVRKKSVAKAKAEEEMNESLREMNENAMKALKKDLMANPSLASQYGIKLKPKEPESLPQFGPEPRPQSSDADKESSDEESEADDTEEKEDTGAEATVGTWHMAASDEGYPYYWNDITSEVTWVAPAAYLAQQEKKKTESSESDDRPKKVRKSKKSSAALTEPPAKEEEEPPQSLPSQSYTEEKEDTDEPVPKKAKIEEPLALVDIPLPGDIPLPPAPGEEDEKKEEKEEEAEEKDDTPRSQTKRPKSHASYGTWEQVEQEAPEVEPEDMGLPQVAAKAEPTISIPVPEAKLKFREKTVSSLGSGPVFFKKPKKKMTAAQFLKKREDS